MNTSEEVNEDDLFFEKKSISKVLSKSVEVFTKAESYMLNDWTNYDNSGSNEFGLKIHRPEQITTLKSLANTKTLWVFW